MKDVIVSGQFWESNDGRGDRWHSRQVVAEQVPFVDGAADKRALDLLHATLPAPAVGFRRWRVRRSERPHLRRVVLYVIDVPA